MLELTPFYGHAVDKRAIATAQVGDNELVSFFLYHRVTA